MADVVFTVIMAENGGGVSVSGPIDSKILSYGMLEAAKEAICKYHDKQQDKRVQLASPTDMPPDVIES